MHHKQRFSEITKEFPINQFLFEDNYSTLDFDTFFDLYLPEEKTVENIQTIMYGPSQNGEQM